MLKARKWKYPFLTGCIAIVFPANAKQNKLSDHIMTIKLLTHHNLQKYTLNANKDKLKLSLV